MIFIKAIKLGGKRDGYAIVDADRFDELNQFNWHMDAKGYVRRGVWENGQIRHTLMHDVVNQTPKGSDTDHKNGIRHFNYRDNLRTATRSQNQQNKRKQRGPTTSRFKGVCWVASRANKWVAAIDVNGARVHLGYFNDEVQAAIAYNRAAREYFGEFALLNDVDESLYDPNARCVNRQAIYPGVSWWNKRKNLWRARIRTGGEYKHIGVYNNPETAAKMRDRYIVENRLGLPLTFPEYERR